MTKRDIKMLHIIFIFFKLPKILYCAQYYFVPLFTRTSSYNMFKRIFIQNVNTHFVLQWIFVCNQPVKMQPNNNHENDLPTSSSQTLPGFAGRLIRLCAKSLYPCYTYTRHQYDLKGWSHLRFCT